MSALHVVILAAGKSTRMKSARPKVVHELGGLPLIEHVLRTVDRLAAASTTLVIGHGADDVRAALKGRTGCSSSSSRPNSAPGTRFGRPSRCLPAKRGRSCCSTQTSRCSSRTLQLVRVYHIAGPEREALVVLAGKHHIARAGVFEDLRHHGRIPLLCFTIKDRSEVVVVEVSAVVLAMVGLGRRTGIRMVL